jgi:hypothetical protein
MRSTLFRHEECGSNRAASLEKNRRSDRCAVNHHITCFTLTYISFKYKFNTLADIMLQRNVLVVCYTTRLNTAYVRDSKLAAMLANRLC